MSVRVAVVQLGIGEDQARNLRHCVGWIAKAATVAAQLVVLPEFCNYPSFYRDQQDAWRQAVALDGPFPRGIAAAAAEHGCYVSVTVSLRGDAEPRVWDSQLLYSPEGRLVARHDKEVLFGQENDYLTPGTRPARVVETPLGRLGLYSCMDGVVPETPRVPALRGAQVLLNSLNSCARDEGELHIPVRAAENHVWVAAANKAYYDVPGVGRVWGGRSEIVDPKGRLVAQANSDGREEIVWADIEPALADDKRTAAGGHLFRDRRPRAYQILAAPLEALPCYVQEQGGQHAQATARLAVVQAATLAEARRLAQQARAQVVALPERFPATVAELVGLARELGCYLSASVLDGGEHVGVLLGPTGEVALRYRPVHPRPGSSDAPGDGFLVADTPYGRVGLMVGYDGVFPESARVLALLGADIIVYPTTWTEEWEPRLGVHERAAENHVHLLAAARLDSPVRAGSVLIPVERRTVVRGSNLTLNRFEALEAPSGRPCVLVAEADVRAPRDKGLFYRTDVLAQRRPEHYGALVEALA